jgi:hypothetical protein
MADTLRETKKPLTTRARTSFGVATAFPNAANHLHKSVTCPVSDALGTPGIIERGALTRVPVSFSYKSRGGVGDPR